MHISRLGTWLALALVVIGLGAGAAMAQGSDEGLRTIGEGIRELEFEAPERTGEFNIYALVGVLVGVVALTALLWILTLAVSKLLLVLVPVAAGVAAAFYVPVTDEWRTWLPPALLFASTGAVVCLVCLLYSTIHDLKNDKREEP